MGMGEPDGKHEGPAVAMIEGVEADGELGPGQPIVEVTGGSTGSSLAMVSSRQRLPPRMLTDDCSAREKIHTMRATGTEVEVFETPAGAIHPRGNRRMARTRTDPRSRAGRLFHRSI